MKADKRVSMSCDLQFSKRLLLVLVSGFLAMTAWCTVGTWMHDGVTWEFDYSGSTATITGATGYYQYLAIPDKVYVGTAPYTVTAIGDGAFDATAHPLALSISWVTIPSSVKTIGSYAFYGCANLAKLELVYNAVSGDCVEKIKSSAFQNASKLTEVEFPKKLNTIEINAFAGCAALETVKFTCNALSIAMSPNSVFSGTPFLEHVNDNDYWKDAIELTGSEGRTSGCNILATEDAGEPLDGYTLWWKWTAPAGVKKAVFYTYGSSFWTRLGVYTGSAVNALTQVALGDKRLSDDTSFVPFDAEPGRTYYICVTGPTSYFNGTVNLGWMAADGFSLVVQDNALLGFIGECPASVTVPDEVSVIEKNAFAYYTDTSVDNLTSVVIPGSEVRIGGFAFWSCTHLSSVTFENPEASIEITDIQYAFYNTPYLASLQSNDKFANATEITGASGAVMAWSENASVETGEPLYAYDHTLWWKWKAPAGVTKAKFHTYGSVVGDTVLGVYTGNALSALTLVDFNDKHSNPSWDDENEKKSLVSFDVTPGKTYYICVAGKSGSDKGIVRLGWCATGGFSLLTWGETLLESVGECPASVTIPDTITEIVRSAFDHDYFPSVDNLKSVAIPAGVTAIGDWAFYECPNLSSVTFEGEVLEIDMNPLRVFSGTPFLDTVNANDGFANAIELTGKKGSVEGWNAFATTEVDEPVDTECHSLWWKWTAPAGVTKAMFHTAGSQFDTVLGVYEGTAVDALTDVAINDDRGGASFVSFDVTPGKTYYICVAGFNEYEGGSVKLSWEAANSFSLVIVDGVLVGFLGDCPQTVTIPNTVTEIGESVFDVSYDASAVHLRNVVIPGSVTAIRGGAFSDCTHLASVTFNEGLELIEDNAFAGCIGLKGQTIFLPTTVTAVDEDAFRDIGGALTLMLPRSLNGMLSSGASGTTDLTVGYYVKVTLDPNGGVLADCVRMLTGDTYGDLSPLPTRTGYTFKGWKLGDTAITATTALPDVATLTLTAQWEIIKHTVTLDFGGEIVVDYGTKVGDLPKPTRDHYAFIGWCTADGTLLSDDTPITSDLQLFAKWKAVYYLYGNVGDAVPAVASTYDGYLYKGETLAGTITVKVGKPSKAGLSSVKATVVLADGKVSLKTAGRGTAMSKDAPTTVTFTGGAACEVTLGSDGMKGTYGDYSIDGARNVFVSKDAEDRSVAGAVLSAWRGAVNVAWKGENGWNGLSVSIANKGKASVSGCLADGTKVTAKGQVIVGEEWCCVPVLVTRKANLAFLLWLPLGSGTQPGTLGLGDDVKVDKPGNLKGDSATFHIDSAAFNTMWGTSALPYLPDGVTVKGGLKWELPKAGKVAYERGSTTVDATKLQENPAALKLKFKSKDGTFSGSFKAYADVGGKLKATTVTVSGVLVNGVGYGTATIKRVGSVPVTVE